MGWEYCGFVLVFKVILVLFDLIGFWKVWVGMNFFGFFFWSGVGDIFDCIYVKLFNFGNLKFVLFVNIWVVLLGESFNSCDSCWVVGNVEGEVWVVVIFVG